MNRSRLLVAVFFTAGLALESCKKETEIQIRETQVDKKYSWSEVPSLYGLNRVILSTGNDGQSIYLQQPNFFTRFINQNPRRGLMTSIGPPSDVNMRLPIGAQIFAYPLTDTTLVICRNKEPLNSQAYVELRRFDPTAIRFNTRVFTLSKCMAINKNNYLLAPYDNRRSDRPLTFLLAAVTPGTLGGPPVTASTRQVVIPRNVSSGAYVRNLEAIDDYFLVNLGDAGIYKIKQDGSYRQVHGPAIADAFYKWNNTVYAPVEYNEMLISTTDGDTWQRASGTPTHFTLANYYSVRDSLVGVYQNAIYTLRWNRPRFTSRFLKNDGLERATITGVEYLHDTVYVATTSGLFARPVKEFFLTKE